MKIFQNIKSSPPGYFQPTLQPRAFLGHREPLSYLSRLAAVETAVGRVLNVDCDLGPGLAVTASRDTTVKVWSVTSGELVLSLRGHTGPVTGVRLLNMEDSQALGAVIW